MGETIESILNGYVDLIQQRTVLAEMLRRLNSVTEKDMIEVLTYGKRLPHQEGSPPRVTGSPELYVTDLRDAFMRKYQKELDICIDEYHAVDMKINLVESAVAALPEQYSQVIEALYFRGLTWDAVEAELHVSRTSVKNYRRKALEILEHIWDRYSDMLLP